MNRGGGGENLLTKGKFVNGGENTVNGGTNTMNEGGIYVNGGGNTVGGGDNTVYRRVGISLSRGNICMNKEKYL